MVGPAPPPVAAAGLLVLGAYGWLIAVFWPGAVRIVIAEDLFLLREGLVRLLSAHGFEIAAAVASAPELLEALVEQRPDVGIVDVRGSRQSEATSACLARTASAAARRPASSASVRSRSTIRRMPTAPSSASTPR